MNDICRRIDRHLSFNYRCYARKLLTWTSVNLTFSASTHRMGKFPITPVRAAFFLPY